MNFHNWVIISICYDLKLHYKIVFREIILLNVFLLQNFLSVQGLFQTHMPRYYLSSFPDMLYCSLPAKP